MAQVLFLAEALRREWRVAVPFAEQAGWDAVIQCGDQWRSVQVKTAYKREGRSSYCVDTMKGGGYGNKRTTASRKYRGDEFDLLAAVDVVTGRVWLLPMSEVAGRRSVALPK